MYPKDCAKAFEVLMQETPYSHFDSSCDGICPECRSCKFHRPYWKYQSCVFEECPYSPVKLSTLKLKLATILGTAKIRNQTSGIGKIPIPNVFCLFGA